MKRGSGGQQLGRCGYTSAQETTSRTISCPYFHLANISNFLDFHSPLRPEFPHGCRWDDGKFFTAIFFLNQMKSSLQQVQTIARGKHWSQILLAFFFIRLITSPCKSISDDCPHAGSIYSWNFVAGLVTRFFCCPHTKLEENFSIYFKFPAAENVLKGIR